MSNHISICNNCICQPNAIIVSQAEIYVSDRSSEASCLTFHLFDLDQVS